MASSGLRPKKTGVGSAAGTARPAAWSRATSATLGAQVSSGLTGKVTPATESGQVRTGPKVLLQQLDSLRVLCILLPQSQSYWILSCPKAMITCPPCILRVRTSWGLPREPSSSLPAIAGGARDTGSIPGLGRFPWRRKWQSTPVFLPGESPWTEELRSLADYSPRSCKKLDTTE